MLPRIVFEHAQVSGAYRTISPAPACPIRCDSVEPSGQTEAALLFDGWQLRALTVVGAFTREALAVDVDHHGMARRDRQQTG